MATLFLGEIKMFGGNFEPAGWHFCDGSLLSISDNSALFQLIGTTYGGDGQNNFALPDLRSRIPIHQGTGPDGFFHSIGEVEGVEAVTLTSQQMPSHSHHLLASTSPSTIDSPAGPAGSNGGPAVAADTTATGVRMYTDPTIATTMDGHAISVVGGSQPHENRMPCLAVTFIIALEGAFPVQS